MKNLFAWKVSLECKDEVGIPKTRSIILEVCLDYREEVFSSLYIRLF